MKKCVLLGALVLLMMVLLAACGCNHVWSEAGCTDIPVCTLCGITKPGASAVGHKWEKANCDTPKTCTVCAVTEGDALGHSWEDATCTAPQTCTRCNLTTGEPKDHNWQAASCMAPRTCRYCKCTEGEPAPHSWKAATCQAPKTCMVCSATEGEVGEHDYAEATCTEKPTCTVCGKTQGSKLGHDYQNNVCTRCNDIMIESFWDLSRHLNQNYNSIHTAIGEIDGITFEVEVNDPNYWDSQDFEILIESTLLIDELDCTLDYALIYGDFLPYDDRIQAVVDVLNFQLEIIRIAEAAFPGMKFDVKFFVWGYEYPYIEVGYWSITKWHWTNWEDDPTNDSVGYTGTRLAEWTIHVSEAMDFGSYQERSDILEDIKKAFPEYTISFGYVW